MKELPTDTVSRTTIEFKHNMSRDLLENLLDYIVKRLPQGEIVYNETTNTHIVSRRLSENEKLSAVIKREITGLAGVIFSGEVLTQFEMYRNPEQRLYSPESFAGMRFIISSGYKLNELRKEEVELMDKIRGLVEKYGYL